VAAQCKRDGLTDDTRQPDEQETTGESEQRAASDCQDSGGDETHWRGVVFVCVGVVD